jgi:hypothetical protein
MQLSTNQIEGTLHERKAGQVTNNPLRYVPPSMVLMVLKAARTSIASAKKLLEPFREAAGTPYFD